MTRPERAQNDARPEATGRASHQQKPRWSSGSTLVGDTVAPPIRNGNGGTSRIDPDTRGVQWTVVGLVGLLGLTSFAVSFRALHDVAAWAGIGPGLQWAVPVFIDGAILTYALAVLVHRSRGESVWPSWVSLAVFTAMSVAANAAHALAMPQGQWWQTLVGAALAALAPLGVFAATEQMARLVVLRPQDRQVAAPVEHLSSEQGQNNEESEGEQEAMSPPVEETEGLVQVSQPSEDIALAVTPAPSRSAAEPADSEPSEEDFAAWVQERRREGDPITGSTAGGFLGVSERTGRNRIKELRKARPELFEEDAA